MLALVALCTIAVGAPSLVALRPVTRGQATVDKIQVKTGLQAGERHHLGVSDR